MDAETKEVYYYQYCPKCKYWRDDDTEECRPCLTQGYNQNSHKPIGFVEKDWFA
jgi:RNA polymerase subunit RPABC4/transcription elongation factor Spt4